MTYRYEQSECECPRSLCDSTDVLLVYEEIFKWGREDPVAIVLEGAECEVCELRFVNSDVRDENQRVKDRIGPKDL